MPRQVRPPRPLPGASPSPTAFSHDPRPRESPHWPRAESECRHRRRPDTSSHRRPRRVVACASPKASRGGQGDARRRARLLPPEKSLSPRGPARPPPTGRDCVVPGSASRGTVEKPRFDRPGDEAGRLPGGSAAQGFKQSVPCLGEPVSFSPDAIKDKAPGRQVRLADPGPELPPTNAVWRSPCAGYWHRRAREESFQSPSCRGKGNGVGMSLPRRG
jgi:hypothetical protein